MEAHEIESLVVRLMGDSSQYAKMMDDAARATQESAEKVEQQAGRMENAMGGLREAAAAAASALGAIGISDWLRGGLAEWQESESVALRLEAAIRSNGRAVEPLMQQYRQFASELQNVTTVGDDATLAMLQQAESMGLTGEAAMRAARNSIALAAAKGGEASSFLRLTAALEQGNSEMLGRMLPALRQIEDPTLRAAEAQRLLAGMFDVATAEASSSRGQLAQLANAYGDLMEEVGKVVDDAMKPLVGWVKDAVAWFASLDQGTKELIVTTAIFTAAFLATYAVVKAALLVIHALTGGVLLWIGVITAAAVASAMWVQSLGGFANTWAVVAKAAGQAWDWIKGKAMEFWDWFRPIALSIGQLASTAWEMIKSGATQVWEYLVRVFTRVKDYIAEIWSGIAGDTEINWTTVRDTIRDAIIAAEFVMLNFKEVVRVAWLAAQLGVVRLGAEIQHLFTGVLPAVLNWFSNNWQDIFQTAFNFATTMMRNLSTNVVSVLSRLPDLIRGRVNFNQLWTPLTEGFVSTIRELPNIPRREMGQLETALQSQVDTARTNLQGSWQQFHAQRLAQLTGGATVQKTQEAATETGRRVGENFAREAAKEVQKFDAALAGSAEAMQRVAEFADRVALNRPTPQPNGAPRPEELGDKALIAVQAAPAAPGAKPPELTKMVDYLRVLAEQAMREAQQPTTTVTLAGLT